MQNSNEYQLLVDRILASISEKSKDGSAHRQFEAAVHQFLREAAERGMAAEDLLAQIDSGVRFNPLIDLIRVRLFGATRQA